MSLLKEFNTGTFLYPLGLNYQYERDKNFAILRKQDSLRAIFSIPGFGKENIDIDYENGSLTVTASRDSLPDDWKLVSGELCTQFCEKIKLPQGQFEVDNATYENGILTIDFVKKNTAKKICIS